MSVSNKIRRDLDLLFEDKKETKVVLDEATMLLQQALEALQESSPELVEKIQALLEKENEEEVDEDEEEVDEAKEEEVDEDEEEVDEAKKLYAPRKPKNIGTSSGDVVCKVRRRPTRRGSRKFEL